MSGVVAVDILPAMSEQRRYHYLSQLYLIGWADKRNEVWRLDEHGRATHRGVGNFAQRDYYYKIEGLKDHKTGQDDPQVLEKFYARSIEANSNNYLTRCREKTQLPKNRMERETFDAFVLMHHVRVPASRDEVSRKAIIEKEMEWELGRALFLSMPADLARRELEKWTTDVDGLLAALQQPAKEMGFHVENNTDMAPLMQEFRDRLPYISGMKLRILVAGGPTKFITGDRPVCLFRSYEDTRLTFDDPDVNVTFPIGPLACAHYNWGGKEGVFDIGEELVNELNHRLAAQSRLELFGLQKQPLIDLYNRVRQKKAASAS